jgi:hypothetical protein
VFAALAISRRIEARTGWSIRKFVKTARRYRAIQIQAGPHTITAADRSPPTSASPSTASTANSSAPTWPTQARNLTAKPDAATEPSGRGI